MPTKKKAVATTKQAKEIKVKRTPKPAPIKAEEIEVPAEIVGNNEILDETKEDLKDDLKDDNSGKVKKYYEAVGRRKTAIARVRLLTIRPLAEDEGKIEVNGKSYKEYFPIADLQQTVEASLKKLKALKTDMLLML